MKWRYLISILFLGGMFGAPVFPEDLTFRYAYEVDVAANQAQEPQPYVSTTTGQLVTPKKTATEPVFDDTDGDGKVYVAVFTDQLGQKSYAEIDQAKYRAMGRKNGHQSNPTKTEYQNAIQKFTPITEAAIARTDAQTGDTANGATSITVSITGSGSNTFDLAFFTDGSGDSATGCTSNGSTMTQLKKQTKQTGGVFFYAYGLHNTATGAHNVVCSRSGTTADMNAGVVALNGADQTVTIDASGSTANTAASISPSLISVADNTAIYSFAGGDNGLSGTPAGSNCTNLGTIAGAAVADLLCEHNTFPFTPAGETSITTNVVNGNNGGIIISIAPAAAAASSIESDLIIFE